MDDTGIQQLRTNRKCGTLGNMGVVLDIPLEHVAISEVVGMSIRRIVVPLDDSHHYRES